MKRFWQGRSDVIVSDATSADMPQLSDLHATGFARGWGTAELAAMVQGAGVTCQIARKVGGGSAPPSGFVMFRQAVDEAEILTIAVAPAHRGKGIANTLMRSAIRTLQGDQVTRLILEVDGANLPALALYRRLGFVQVGQRKGYYANGTADTPQSSDALVMALDLI